MQSKEVTVRLQALDGVWEVGGRDRKRGIMPENVSLTSDLWGPATASFDLRRDPRSTWPDLGAYTPVEVEVGGKVVWSGRVQQTPTSSSAGDRVISVQAQGWQYHLDDDLYERVYVQTSLSAWRDLRTFPDTVLGASDALAAGQVSSDNGTVQIAIPKGTVLPAGAAAGPLVAVVLDLGPNSTAAGISIDYETSANDGTTVLYTRGASTTNVSLTTANNAGWSGTTLVAAGASGSVRGAFGTASRYVLIMMVYTGAAATAGADLWVKLKGIRVFTNDSWRSTDASILKASDVITDALSQAQSQLSTDRTGITTTSFAIPDFAMSGPQTPREVWSAVNAYHDYIAQVDVQKRPVFKAKPTAPMYEVGAWSPLELEDQSANSGDDIYNRVIVTGTQPDGTPLRVTRSAAQQSGVVLTPSSLVSVANPSFATDAANWTNVTRTTTAGQFDTSPAGGVITIGAIAVGTLSGTFKKGVTYALSVRIAVSDVRSRPAVTFGLSTDNGAATMLPVTANTFQTVLVSWTPKADTSAATVQIADNRGGYTIYIDTLNILTATPTIIDRRGFTRTKELPVSGALTEVAAQQIADLWLAAHKTTPYKGSFKLIGDRSVRDPANGTPVKLETLLLHTGELIRDTAAIDPDTGGIGRDGRVAQVTYTPATEEATVTLDNTRASFEALMARLDLINGVGK